MVEQLRVNLMDIDVEVDNRDSNTTWVHVDGVIVEITREYLWSVYDMTSCGHVVRREHVDLLLDYNDIVYLLENMDENNEEENKVEQARVQNYVAGKVLEWSIRYVHALCNDDESTLECVMEETDLTERQLMEGFDDVATDCGFVLDKKVDGYWVKRQVPEGVGMTTVKMDWEYRNEYEPLSREEYKEIQKVFNSFMVEGEEDIELARMVGEGDYDVVLEMVIRKYINMNFQIVMDDEVFGKLIEVLGNDYSHNWVG